MPFCGLTLQAEKPQFLPDYPTELVTLGDHIRQRRLELGLTQKETALLIRVEECSIWNWENHRCEPEIPLMPYVIAFLGYVPYEPRWTMGKKIIAWRKSIGLSQKEMARAVGIDPSTLARYEQDKRRPANKFLQTMIQFIAEYEQQFAIVHENIYKFLKRLKGCPLVRSRAEHVQSRLYHGCPIRSRGRLA